MSIVANTMLISTLKEKFSDVMPASMMEFALETIQQALYDYELTRVVIEDSGSDYMLDVYLESLSIEGRSEKTISRYRHLLSRFLSHAGVTSGNVTTQHIRKYLADEKSRGVMDSTLRSIYWVLTSYFAWLNRDGLIKKDPTLPIGTIKVAKKIKEVFSDLDLEKLKTGCSTPRDKAIVYLLKSTGCRISEITSLNRTDIDFINREIIVLGKGNKQRIVYIDMVTAAMLKTYLDSRTDDDPALFIGKRHERLQPGGVRNMLKVLGKKVGVNHVHPHKFRRTEITELVNRGMPIEQVRALAGHEKIDTTLLYVVTDQELVKGSYHRFA